jgi:hypothetical protein
MLGKSVYWDWDVNLFAREERLGPEEIAFFESAMDLYLQVERKAQNAIFFFIHVFKPQFGSDVCRKIARLLWDTRHLYAKEGEQNKKKCVIA